MGARPRPLQEKEAKRVDSAMQELRRLQGLPVGRRLRQTYCRAFGLAKCTYGWMARTMPLGVAMKISAAVRRTAGGCRMGAVPILAILEGGTLATDVIIGARQMSMLRRRLLRRHNAPQYRQWTRQRGTLCGAARGWMRRLGWEEEAPWRWSHPGFGGYVDLGRRATIEEELRGEDVRAALMHEVREGWRWWNWEQFRKMRRRDAVRMAATRYDEARVRLAREAATASTRRLHLMCGAFLSPMAAAQAGAPGRCRCIWPGCEEAVPDQDHIMWACRRRPEEAPARPPEVLQQRWGWPGGQDRQEDARILRYMEEVVQKVWDDRYPQNEARRAAQERLRRETGKEEAQEERREEVQRGAEEAAPEDEETGCRRRERPDEPPRSPEDRGKRRRKQEAAAGRPKRALPEGEAEALRGRWKQGRRTGARQDEGGGRQKRGRPEEAEDGGRRKAGRRAGGGGKRGRPEGHCQGDKGPRRRQRR